MEILIFQVLQLEPRAQSYELCWKLWSPYHRNAGRGHSGSEPEARAVHSIRVYNYWAHTEGLLLPPRWTPLQTASDVRKAVALPAAHRRAGALATLDSERRIHFSVCDLIWLCTAGNNPNTLGETIFCWVRRCHIYTVFFLRLSPRNYSVARVSWSHP